MTAIGTNEVVGTPTGLSAATATKSRPGLRIGDLERAEAESALGQALALGQLDRAEFDGRLDRVLGAKWAGDLTRELADLPTDQVPRQARRARRAESLRRGLQVHVVSVGGAVALMVAIWLLTGVVAGAWYPWPVWPIMGAILGVSGHAFAIRGAAPRATR